MCGLTGNVGIWPSANLIGFSGSIGSGDFSNFSGLNGHGNLNVFGVSQQNDGIPGLGGSAIMSDGRTRVQWSTRPRARVVYEPNANFVNLQQYV